MLLCAGIAGAISRTCTAPVDRLKMLLQIQDGATALTLRGGMQKMAAEGRISLHLSFSDLRSMGFCALTYHACAGTIKAYFRGNGVNVVKIAPETALRLTLNDRIKAVVAKNHLERITPWERMACGGLAGASAQVSCCFVCLLNAPFQLSLHIEVLQPLLCMKFGLLPLCMETQTGRFSPLRANRTVPSMLGDCQKLRLSTACCGKSRHCSLSPLLSWDPDWERMQAIIYPMELVRTRLAVSSQGQYKGMGDCIRNVLKHEGVRAFYRGLTPSLVTLLTSPVLLHTSGSA